MDLSEGLHTLLMVSLVAGLAPLIAGLLPIRVPQVVLLIVGGVLIGPEVLAWAETGTISLLSDVGLGFLFLLAGYELDLDLFNRQPGHRALGAWFITAGLAIAVTGALAATDYVHAFIPVAIGLTTTALGTLLPILRDSGETRTPFGTTVLAGAAVGELGPIVAITILLGSDRPARTLVVLVIFVVVVIVTAALAMRERNARMPG